MQGLPGWNRTERCVDVFAKPPKIYDLAWQTTYGVSRNSRIEELEDLDKYKGSEFRLYIRRRISTKSGYQSNRVIGYCD